MPAAEGDIPDNDFQEVLHALQGSDPTLYYVRLARDAILDLLDREHAVLWLEVEAKLAERPHPRIRRSRGNLGGLDPHILTRARSQLTKEGLIEQIASPTRGKRSIAV